MREKTIKATLAAISVLILGQPSTLASGQTEGSPASRDHSVILKAYRSVSGGLRDA